MVGLGTLVATVLLMEGGWAAAPAGTQVQTKMEAEQIDFEQLEGALQIAFRGRFAGLWVDDSGEARPDRIHVAVADLRPEDHEAARTPMALAAAGIDYVLHPVAYSEDELRQFLAPFLALPAEGELPEELTGVGIDVTQNAVVVTVSSPPQGKLAEMVSRVPSSALRLTTGTFRLG
jgi:hypothetical protein